MITIFNTRQTNQIVLAITIFFVSWSPIVTANIPGVKRTYASAPVVVWAPGIEEYQVSSDVEAHAKKLYENELETDALNTRFIADTKTVHRYLTDPSLGQGITMTCVTDDNETIECTYFDRESDHLVIVGPGFTNIKEYMVPFLALCDCDVMLFNYRGHTYQESIWYKPSTWKLNPSQILFDVQGSKVKMGEVEEKDVIAVVEHAKKQKPYSSVCGIGICYSALIFVKAQAIYQQKYNINLFDKLICDGTWLCLKNQVERITNDLKLMCSPQHGGWKNKWPNGRPWFTNSALWLVKHFVGIDFVGLKVNILDYLPSINIPILFFHGKDDLFAPLNEFEIIWNNTPSKEKVALITSNPHVRNHLYQKELYKYVCKNFCNCPYQEFLQTLPAQVTE